MLVRALAQTSIGKSFRSEISSTFIFYARELNSVSKSRKTNIFYCGINKNGVLRKLKHIFPNTYQRIKSIRSPAKVGLVVTDLITSPVVSWEGWETPPPQHRGSAVILCMTSSGGQRGGRRAIIFILW